MIDNDSACSSCGKTAYSIFFRGIGRKASTSFARISRRKVVQLQKSALLYLYKPTFNPGNAPIRALISRIIAALCLPPPVNLP